MEQPYLFNGNTLFAPFNNDSLIGYGINDSSTFEPNAFDNERVSFDYESDVKAFPMIIIYLKVSDAEEYKSYLYLPGRENTNTWYIKGYELSQPLIEK